MALRLSDVARRLFSKAATRRPTTGLHVEALERRDVPAAFGLYETGLGVAGHVLPAEAGDAHYTLTGAGRSAGGVRAIADDGFPIGPWVGNDPTSRWVVPAGSDGDGSAAPGTYVYRATVDTTGYDPATVVVSGLWASDDTAVIRVNGAATANAVSGFHGLAPFALSGFHAGANVVEFVVTNGDTGGPNPTGLRVAGVTGTGTARVGGPVAVPGAFDTGAGGLAVGAADGHYTVVSAPTPAVVGPAVGAVAHPYWAAAGSPAGWVVPLGMTGESDTPAGVYTYRTTFDLTGYDPATASLSGLWAADDAGEGVYLNGGLVPGTVAGPRDFADTPFAAAAGFVAGVNVLEFRVRNFAQPNGEPVNPSGLRVTGLQVFATPVAVASPETSVTGRVWSDANENGRPNSDEAGVGGAVVETADNPDFIGGAVAVTEADGSYTLTTREAAAPYKRVTLPSGLVFVFSNGVLTSITSTAAVTPPGDEPPTDPVPPPPPVTPGSGGDEPVYGTDDWFDWYGLENWEEYENDGEEIGDDTQFISTTTGDTPPAADPLPATLTGPPAAGFDAERHASIVAEINAWWQGVGGDRRATLVAWWQKATPAERTALLESLNEAYSSDTRRDSILKQKAGVPEPVPSPEPEPEPPQPQPEVAPPPRPRTGTAADLQQWQADAAQEQAARDARGDQLLRDLKDDRDARFNAAAAFDKQAAAFANARRRSIANIWVYWGTGDYAPLETGSTEERLRKQSEWARDTVNFRMVDGLPVPMTDEGRAKEAAWKDAQKWATMPALDKLGAALNTIADKGLVGEELAKQLKEIAKPENLALMGGVGGVLVG